MIMTLHLLALTLHLYGGSGYVCARGGGGGGRASLEEAATGICFCDIVITLYIFSPLNSLIGEGIQQ